MKESNPRRPCATCALTEGSQAHREPHNNLRAQLCVMGAIPFYCHHDAAGNLRDLADMPRAMAAAEIRAGRLRICEGWRRETKALALSGYFARAAELKRAFAQLGLGALQIFTASDDPKEKRRASKTLRDVLLTLWKSRGYQVRERKGSRR